MPCSCGVKVDRGDLKVECSQCNELVHTSCHGILEKDIDLVKDAFKCNNCLSLRRSLSSPPLPPSAMNSAAHSAKSVNELPPSNSIPGRTGTKPKTLPYGKPTKPATIKNVSIEAVYAELLKLRKSNDKLTGAVSLLRDNNSCLLVKMDNMDNNLSSLRSENSSLLTKVEKLECEISSLSALLSAKCLDVPSSLDSKCDDLNVGSTSLKTTNSVALHDAHWSRLEY